MCAHPSFHFCFLVKDLFVVCDCSLEINFPTHICKQCAFRFCLGDETLGLFDDELWSKIINSRTCACEKVRHLDSLVFLVGILHFD